MDLLSPLQVKVLMAIARSPLRNHFYLSGGTALAAFYLHHRYSVDLDFFTPDPNAVARVPSLMQDIARELELEITFTRTLNTFLKCFLTSDDERRWTSPKTIPFG